MANKNEDADIIESIMLLLKESKNFFKVIIKGEITNVIIEKPLENKENDK